MEEKLGDIITVLNELRDDNTLPKNIRQKVERIIALLSENKEASLKISSALNELDDISNDTNIQPYTRTQLWNVSSLLESTLV